MIEFKKKCIFLYSLFLEEFETFVKKVSSHVEKLEYFLAIIYISSAIRVLFIMQHNYFALISLGYKAELYTL